MPSVMLERSSGAAWVAKEEQDKVAKLSFGIQRRPEALIIVFLHCTGLSGTPRES